MIVPYHINNRKRTINIQTDSRSVEWRETALDLAVFCENNTATNIGSRNIESAAWAGVRIFGRSRIYGNPHVLSTWRGLLRVFHVLY